MPKAKRSILPGFPKNFVFETREQIETYLASERVTCLLCGHNYRILETHLRSVHEITGDDYRSMYGLPFTRGLCGASFSEQRMEHGRRLYEENQERQSAALTAAKAVQAKHGNPQRNKPVYWKRERVQYDRAVYDEFVRRVLSGRAVCDVENDPDMPTTSNVYWYMERDADFERLWQKEVSPVARPGWSLEDRFRHFPPPRKWSRAV
jgi:hypothetical protein